jgi:hypothetical protein
MKSKSTEACFLVTPTSINEVVVRGPESAFNFDLHPFFKIIQAQKFCPEFSFVVMVN